MGYISFNTDCDKAAVRSESWKWIVRKQQPKKLNDSVCFLLESFYHCCDFLGPVDVLESDHWKVLSTINQITSLKWHHVFSSETSDYIVCNALTLAEKFLVS